MGAGGAIRKTSNGGTTWSALTSGTAVTLWGASFPSATSGYVAGFTGTILHTTGTPLPLSVRSLTGRANENVNELQWQAAGEEPGTIYTVERSATGAAFDAVGNVPGDGRPDYSFTDKTAGGTAYYRIRITCAGGKTAFSPVVVVRRADVAQNTITLAPQPVNGTLVLTSTDRSMDGCTVSIVDLRGKPVARVPLGAHVCIDAGTWAPGCYAAQLPDGTVVRILKQ